MTNLLRSLHSIALTSVNLGPLPHASTGSSQISTILDIVFTVVGSISLLVITIAGFRFVTSRGNAQTVAQAREAIIYAAVGLVITIMGFSIVTFVLNGL